jgi:hypothetical protein
LKSTNDVYGLEELFEPKDLFAFKINYNNFEGNVPDVKKLFNGNIAKTYCKTSNDNMLRK